MTITFFFAAFYIGFFLTNRFNVDLTADVPLRFNTCLTFCPEARSFIASRPCSFTLFSFGYVFQDRYHGSHGTLKNRA